MNSSRQRISILSCFHSVSWPTFYSTRFPYVKGPAATLFKTLWRACSFRNFQYTFHGHYYSTFFKSPTFTVIKSGSSPWVFGQHDPLRISVKYLRSKCRLPIHNYGNVQEWSLPSISSCSRLWVELSHLLLWNEPETCARRWLVQELPRHMSSCSSIWTITVGGSKLPAEKLKPSQSLFFFHLEYFVGCLHTHVLNPHKTINWHHRSYSRFQIEGYYTQRMNAYDHPFCDW